MSWPRLIGKTEKNPDLIPRGPVIAQAGAQTPAPEPDPEVEHDQEPSGVIASVTPEPESVPVMETATPKWDLVQVGSAVVTVASAAFTAWTVWDMLKSLTPDALALGLGLGVETLWLWMLAIEWRQASQTGRVPGWLTATGWVLAVGAAVVLFIHGFSDSSWVLAALAAFPLASKAGWHWLTHMRAVATLERLQVARAWAKAHKAEADRARERALALSTELTDAEQQELAELRRAAAFARAKAAAENELTMAQAEADRLRDQTQAEAELTRQRTESEMRQNATRNRAQEQMAMLRANYDLIRERSTLAMELESARPITVGSGSIVPGAPTGVEGLEPTFAPAAGFGGFGMEGATASATGATPADLQVPQGASPRATDTATPTAPGLEDSGYWERPATPKEGQAVLLEYLDWCRAKQRRPGVRDAARRIGDIDPRTVGRWRATLQATHPEEMAAFRRSS